MSNKKHKLPYALPRNAQRVFKGRIWDIYQWPQKTFDGATHIFECIKRPNTAVIIPVVGNKILIQQQAQPHWDRELLSLPAGRCNNREAPLACAKRELLEETGYISRDWELLQRQHPYRNMVWEVSTFIARNCQKIAQQKLDPGERITIRLVSFADFFELTEHPDWRDPNMTMYMYQCRVRARQRREFEKKLFGRKSKSEVQ